MPGTLLSHLHPDARASLLAAGVRRRFDSGETLLHQGDPTDHVLVLRSGWVRVSATTTDGQAVLLALRGPGDVLGELAALHGWPRTATVRALEPVVVAQFRAPVFLEVLHRQPAVAVALLKQLSTRLRDAERARVDSATLDVAHRVAAHVLRLAEQHGEAEGRVIVVRMPLTQQDIADQIGASRRAVARALGTLRERRVVTTGRRLITVHQPDVLRAFTASAPNGT
ncbi:Crp/Fnr family transcriptional regulator [Labedaea rhizosphaerae]|uniref:Crp/Fnr family transcriptional regulator n=1 Tax=Labedaea rhizosphaerae TaxID=598644 RepID=UPI001FB67174|nr:Crp/Fnr family transcriptional regulator [Labedaea rhizosphaerae]